jgi:hypothetical protein
VFPLFPRTLPEVIVIRGRHSPVYLVALMLIIGCGSGADDMSEARLTKMAGGKLKDVVPVSGTVSVDGAPQKGVNLYLYKKGVPGQSIAECRTDSEGRYCWTTHIACDGLVPGSYRLGFTYVPKQKSNDKGVDLFEGRYSDPMKNDFSLTVEDGSPQEDENYELTTK